MTTLEIILLVLTIVGTVWQLYLFGAANALIKAGYRNVRFGVLPGVVAVIAGTWLLLLVAR